MHVKIRSLVAKFVLLTALAYSANPDVLAVSESWLEGHHIYLQSSFS